MLQKQEKSLHVSLKKTELQELNSVSNMPAEIDIDALKIFYKIKNKIMRLNIGLKSKQPV